MTFIKNFLASVSALTFVDFVFFTSMIVLIVLVVSLIYFIKINNDDEEIVVEPTSVTQEEPIIETAYDDENDAIIDLASITKALEERETSPIEMTQYEIEQEERAIISYDELIARSKNLSLNYEEEQINEDLTIRKVDLDNLVSKIEDEKPALEVRVISYKKEEAFLEALKNLKEQIT